MMKKAFCLSLSLLLLAVFVLAQAYKGPARVAGYVYDEEGNPVEAVTVKFFSLKHKDGFEVKTDNKGKWIAAWIRGGYWRLNFSKTGYKPEKKTIRLKFHGRNPDVEVTLKKVEVKGMKIAGELKGELSEGNRLFNEEKYDEAKEVFKKIIDEFPDAYIINKNIGNCYFQMKNYDKAVEYYLKVLEQDPDNPEIMIPIGNCYANKGEIEKAMEWYSKIKFEEIDSVTVLYNIGSQYFLLNKFEQALKYFQRAVEIQEDFLDALYQLGLTHLNLGDNEKAIQVFESYLKHGPDSQRAAQVRAFIDYLKKEQKILL